VPVRHHQRLSRPAHVNDPSIDKAGAGYTLTATAAGIPPVTSAPFDVAPRG
jgi:hypothetical protein